MTSTKIIASAAAIGGAVVAVGATSYVYRWLSAAKQGELIEPADSIRHGGDLVAEVLHAHGVEFVFTLIGGHISPILVGAKARGIRIIDVRHEVNAVFAADAVARLSEQVGVACVTAGPGLSNTITAVKNAQMACSPLVLLGGATLGLLKGRGSLQDIDQQALFRGQVKWQASVTCVQDLVPTLDRAFYEAKSGVPGPVFVELPIDTLYPQETVRKQVLGKLGAERRDVASRAKRWYCERYLRSLYANADRPRHSLPRAVRELRASRHQIEQAKRFVDAAERPVLVLGSACVADTARVAAVAEAARIIGMPVWLSDAARGLLGTSDPLYMRHKRGEALKRADLVVLCGVPCDFRLGYGAAIRGSCPLVSVNPSREQLYLNRTPTLAVQASPGNFLTRLADLMRGQQKGASWSQWIAELRARSDARDDEIAEQAEAPPARDLNPLALCFCIDAALGDNSVLVADGGDFIGTVAYTVRPRRPLSFVGPGPFGTLGVGAGFALGAKLVNPDAQVWLLWGDGSAGFSLMEYDTFKRHNIGVIGVIGNDSCWSQIARDQVTVFNDDVGCPLSRECEYETVAAALGGVGWRVSQDGTDAVSPKGGSVPIAALPNVLECAKRVAASGTPVLINALMDKSDFRKGSISV